MLQQAKTALKRIKVSRHHSGSSGVTPISKLLWQGLPYYLNRRGFARNPLTVFISVNGRCNLRCRLCDIGNKTDVSQFHKNLAGETGQDFPIERLKTLLDEISTFKPYIGVTTTEPLLYKPMWDAVRHAKSRGMEMNITTGGLTIDTHVDEILDSGLHKISVSIDGPPAIHNEMRAVPGAYERIMKGLNQLIEKKKSKGLKYPYIYITTFVADTNNQHLVELMSGLPLDGIEHINIKMMLFLTKEVMNNHNSQFGEKYPATVSCMPDDFFADKIDLDILIDQVREIEKRYKDKLTLHFEADKSQIDRYLNSPTEFMDSTKCVFPWYLSQITNEGDLITVTRCFNVKFGNIMEKPFSQVWNGQKFREFRMDLQKHGRFPGCSRCDGLVYR